MTKLTKETLKTRIVKALDDFTNGRASMHVPPLDTDVDIVLAEVLAAMDAEPVAWDYEWASCITCEGPQNFNRVIEREAPPEWAVDEGQARNIIPLYRNSQPAPVINAEPVAWTDQDELNAIAKGSAGYLFAVGGEVNKFADPHRQLMLYTAPPAPVAIDERAAFNEWNNDTDCPLAGRDSKTAAWLAWSRRAAMLQPPHAVQTAPELDSLPKADEPLHASNESSTKAITPHFDTIALETAREIMSDVNRRQDFLGGDVQLLSRIQCRIDEACRAAALQEKGRCDHVWITKSMDGSNSNCEAVCKFCGANPSSDQPVSEPHKLPAGYVAVPLVPTVEMIAAAMNSDDVLFDKDDDTVFYVQHREIYDAMVFAALAGQQEGQRIEAQCNHLLPIGELIRRLEEQTGEKWSRVGDYGQWIACSDRMPEMGEKQTYVLAADFKNHYWHNLPNKQVGVFGDWFSDGNPTWDDGDGNDLHLKEVTHWMPLPAAPKTEIAPCTK